MAFETFAPMDAHRLECAPRADSTATVLTQVAAAACGAVADGQREEAIGFPQNAEAWRDGACSQLPIAVAWPFISIAAAALELIDMSRQRRGVHRRCAPRTGFAGPVIGLSFHEAKGGVGAYPLRGPAHGSGYLACWESGQPAATAPHRSARLTARTGFAATIGPARAGPHIAI